MASASSSWNPFSRFSGCKDGPIPSTDLRDFNRERDELLRMEKVCRKMGQELKKYQESISALAQCEQTMGDNLVNLSSSHALATTTENFKRSIEEATPLTKQLVTDVRATNSDPVKHFNETYQIWHGALRRWDTALQECNKLQSKVDKYHGKQTDPQAAAKYEQSVSSLEVSKKTFYELHNQILTDMRKSDSLKRQRFEPSYEALIRLQLLNFDLMHQTNTARCVSTGADRIPDSDSVYKEQMRQRFNQIRALSIVADD